MAADMGRGNLKISQKQRSRLEGVELDKSVSNIYSRPPEAPDVQVAAALGQQALKFTESLRIGVGLICSSGTFCPLIPFFFFFICMPFCFPVWEYEIHKEGGLRALKNNIRLTVTAAQPNSPTGPLITACTVDRVHQNIILH